MRARLLPAALGLILLLASAPLAAQQLSSGDLGRLLSWKPEEEFASQMRERFADLKSPDALRFDRLSSVVAVPAKGIETLTLDGLAKEGALIGGLYLSSGSTRLGLPPGIYAVRVRFDWSAYGWIVDHLDPGGEVSGTVRARVGPADSIEDLVSYVDYSVCYRADSWVVCY